MRSNVTVNIFHNSPFQNGCYALILQIPNVFWKFATLHILFISKILLVAVISFLKRKFQIKMFRISWLAPYFCVHNIYIWKTKRVIFLKNTFRSSKCNNTPPSRYIIGISTNEIVLMWFVLIWASFWLIEYSLKFNDFKLTDPGEEYISSKWVQETTSVKGSFLLRIEQVFVCRIYFISVYIISVETTF